MTFSSSGSIKTELMSGMPGRAPLLRRLKVILWDCNVLSHLLYIFFVITAVTYSTSYGIRTSPLLHELLVFLLTHAFWPPVLWIMCIAGCWVPIKYAIWPPTMPQREELLVRDEKTGTVRQKEEWKRQRFGIWGAVLREM